MDRAAAAPLRDLWYFALTGETLRRGGMVAKMLLGEPLLLGRAKDGSVFALRDICPHRGIPLSDGRFDGAEIECCYHGWRFAPGGRCTAIPSLAAAQEHDVGRIGHDPVPLPVGRDDDLADSSGFGPGHE